MRREPPDKGGLSLRGLHGTRHGYPHLLVCESFLKKCAARLLYCTLSQGLSVFISWAPDLGSL